METVLIDAIENLIEKLKETEVGTDVFDKLTVQISKLAELLPEQKPWYNRVSPDVWVGVGGNLLAIILVLNFERLGVISTRATSFWKRTI